MGELLRQYQIALEHRRRFDRFSDDWLIADEDVLRLGALVFEEWMRL